jgi:hypothetical protein
MVAMANEGHLNPPDCRVDMHAADANPPCASSDLDDLAVDCLDKPLRGERARRSWPSRRRRFH